MSLLGVVYVKWHNPISVRDEFRSGGLKSLALIFSSIACTQIKWFCPNIIPAFLPENGYLINSRGAAAPPQPHGPYIRLCIYQFPTSPLFNFFYSNQGMGGGGGSIGPCALSYVSDSGVTRICQRGAKAPRGCGRGVSPPTVRRFLKIRVSKWQFFAH